MGWVMCQERTTAAVQRFLDQLAGDSPAEPIVGRCSTGPSAGCTCSTPPRCTAAKVRVQRTGPPRALAFEIIGLGRANPQEARGRIVPDTLPCALCR